MSYKGRYSTEWRALAAEAGVWLRDYNGTQGSALDVVQVRRWFVLALAYSEEAHRAEVAHTEKLQKQAEAERAARPRRVPMSVVMERIEQEKLRRAQAKAWRDQRGANPSADRMRDSVGTLLDALRKAQAQGFRPEGSGFGSFYPPGYKGTGSQ